MDTKKKALQAHEQWCGKIEVISRATITTPEELAVAYTPGVAEPCLEIARDADLSYTYTRRGNLVAVVTDGSAVLGLGNIGPEAGMPVMEGKCALFKEFADVDAFPLCIRSQDVDEIVRTVSLLAGSFGGINLEDIAAPRCFEIEARLKECCDIPVFHDDQHGTAIAALAGVIGAFRYVHKDLKTARIVINGAGAAGASIGRLLVRAGARNVTMVDRPGILYDGMEGLNPVQAELASLTNPSHAHGTLADAVKGADLLLGVSAPHIFTKEIIQSMAADAVVFAMANPIPETDYASAKAAGAKVVGTGRSDAPNQINNVMVFPGIFRGALAVRARSINEDMKLAASYAIASLVSDDELAEDHVIPDAFDKRVAPAVAAAVAKTAMDSGVARITRDPEDVRQEAAETIDKLHAMLDLIHK